VETRLDLSKRVKKKMKKKKIHSDAGNVCKRKQGFVCPTPPPLPKKALGRREKKN